MVTPDTWHEEAKKILAREQTRSGMSPPARPDPVAARLEIDGRRFASADDAIRSLVAEYPKKDLVEMLLWALNDQTPAGYVLVNADMLAAAIEGIDSTEIEDVLHGADADRMAAAIFAALKGPAR